MGSMLPELKTKNLNYRHSILIESTPLTLRLPNNFEPIFQESDALENNSFDFKSNHMKMSLVENIRMTGENKYFLNSYLNEISAINNSTQYDTSVNLTQIELIKRLQS